MFSLSPQSVVQSTTNPGPMPGALRLQERPDKVTEASLPPMVLRARRASTQRSVALRPIPARDPLAHPALPQCRGNWPL